MLLFEGPQSPIRRNRVWQKMPEEAFYSQGLIQFAKRFHQHKLKIASDLLCSQLGLSERRSRTPLFVVSFPPRHHCYTPTPQITHTGIARNKSTMTSRYQVWWHSFYQDNNKKTQTENHQETGWGGLNTDKLSVVLPYSCQSKASSSTTKGTCLICTYFPPLQ